MISAEPRPIITAAQASITLKDGTNLLDEVSLDVRAGELVMIVGRSGAGKTTPLETPAG